jgi:hypothetical protein
VTPRRDDAPLSNSATEPGGRVVIVACRKIGDPAALVSVP